MATDRELLEKAARAAGLDVLFGYEPRGAVIRTAPTFTPWNPLTDDGDALRLAVKLGLEVYHTLNDNEWTAFVGYPSNGAITYAYEEYGADPLAATRRAIVRAAAALGEKP